ncbi:MAG TPA: hypothetical protein VNN22_17595 [Verrucomicrobiae bacterium]|nr:hypothetical protein [Verrucomicrobiae bacterium]
MNLRAKKILLLLLAAVLLFGSGRMQKVLNRDREQLGLTRVDALDNAPPVLAFTTVALGGFRGLIANVLWIRANDLQQDDKFFEAAQLATWITQLEPSFTQVWLFQAWNMAYNISVKFKENGPGDFSDRWRWVERGIELLRDEGLRYNPNDTLQYRELAWFFQHKMGQNLDDGNAYYKQQWAQEMAPLFGSHGTNFAELLNPTTPEARTNAQVLRDKYKMDAAFAQKLDQQYGPLDWRLPEAHAIYWGARGLEAAKANPGKVKADDLITVRRNIYQSMLQAFHHGRIIDNPFNKTSEIDLEPNLDLVPKVNDAYETIMAEDAANRDHIATAHRNFLKDAVYFLYENNHIKDAAKWYKLLSEKYPDKTILENDPNSLPRNYSLDEYAVARVQSEIGDTSQERTTAVVQGLLANAYLNMAIGQDDRSAGFKLLARKVYDKYQKEIGKMSSNVQRVGLPPFDMMNRSVLDRLLDAQKPVLPYAARAMIRTQLGMLAETNAPPTTASSTNTLPAAVTNAVENVPTNSAAK